MPNSHSSWFAFPSSILTLMLTIVGTGRAADSADRSTDFAHDVVPILKKHCVECHGGEHSEGGFSLNTRALLLDAEAAVPGQAGESRLIELVTAADPAERMPPQDRAAVSAAEVAVLKAWIDQGLKWEPSFSFAPPRYEPPLQPRRPELPPAVAGRTHPLDRILDAYLAQRNLPRPAAIDDATFLRRASLDVTGLLPSVPRLREFLADGDPGKRLRAVHDLLADDVAYAEHWLTFWNDLLRNDYAGTGYIDGGRKQISAWLYQTLLENKPYDQFVRELIAPSPESAGFIGGIQWRGNVNASQTREIQFSQNVSQVFLGINMKCASCHDSFIDRWKLEEAYGLAAVYAAGPLEIYRCDKATGRMAQPAWLFPELGQLDPQAPQPERLKQLAALLTHPDNGRFTRTIVNRIWQRLMGRGIVHPVDAMHTEPWNADLLDFLAVHLADSGYDLKKTIELIVTSQAYQSQAVMEDEEPLAEAYTYAGPLAKRMTAEQFVDAVWQITGTAPAKIDAPIPRRSPKVRAGASTGSTAIPELTAQFIWSYAEASQGVPQAGEQITLRRRFDLPAVPPRAAAVVTCDNEYILYVNGRKCQADTDWPSIETVPLEGVLREGPNEVLIVARNAGNGPNAAALFFAARLLMPDGTQQAWGSDANWLWTATVPDAGGRFANEPQDWRPAAAVANQAFLGPELSTQLHQAFAQAFDASPLMVRAALVRCDLLMRSLGRPNREQVVTTRPAVLTTLEAIDLANGQIMADTLRRGAAGMLARKADSPDEWLDGLYLAALCRPPTGDERQIARELLGTPVTPQGVEDVLWAVFMLPEFQLAR